MINNVKKTLYSEDIMIENDLIDKYFVKKSQRHSISYKNLSHIEFKLSSNSNINNSNKLDKNIATNCSKKQSFIRSISSPLKIIEKQLYYNLIHCFEDSKIRKDKFGVEIKKSNNKHKIKFASDENLVDIKKVMSYSRITRRLNNEASKQSEGFCYIF